MNIKQPVHLLFAAAVLAGCGGGGDSSSGGAGVASSSSSAPANLSSAPGAAALTAYVQVSHQSTLTARDTAGNSDTLQLNSAPVGGTTSFNGLASVNSSIGTLTLKQNGVLLTNSITTSFFLISPFTPLGSVSSTGIPYGIVSSPVPLPATLTVGGSGPYGTTTYYHNSTKSIVDATATSTYSVSSNNATTLLVCLNTVTSGVTSQGSLDGLAAGTESDCYTNNASGTLTLLSITITVSGTTLTFL